MTKEERHIAVLNRMLENMEVYDSIQPTTERKKAIKAAIKALSQEQKSGKWIDINGIYAECSNCNEEIYITGDFKFCPNCGVRMEGSDKE